MERVAKPNILFIMDDQHRFDYVGCMGAEFVCTPNLDRLASRGMLFNNCFTNSPKCAPARVALATGLQPSRLDISRKNATVPVQVPTLYQRFRDHGYRVGCTGKLDLMKTDHYNGRFGDRPLAFRMGFTHPEECEGKMHAAGSETPIGPYTHYLQEQGHLQLFYKDYQARKSKGWIVGASHDSVLPAEAFEDRYIGKKAVEWIEQIPDDFPWFHFVSFVGPHDPYDPPTEYADKYRNRLVPAAVVDSMEGKPDWVKRKQVAIEPEEIAVTRRQYCAALEIIDEQIGNILAALEKRGMTEQTYVIFTSDHGDMLGDHKLYTKSVAYEPSIHVPLIIAGPGIQAGLASNALIELIDANPTVCELAGLPAQTDIDGLSFCSVLNGEAINHRPDIITSFKNFRCLRDERYKFIENHAGPSELYDLHNDPHELVNLAVEHSLIANVMYERLEERFNEAAPLPDL